MFRMVALAIAVLGLSQESVAAQVIYPQPGPYVRPGTAPFSGPVVSPYVNLARRSSDPAITYYGIVLPEIDNARAINQLQWDVQSIQSATGPNTSSGLPSTGHPTQFMSFSAGTRPFSGNGGGPSSMFRVRSHR
jgi:hypothetical protein